MGIFDSAESVTMLFLTSISESCAMRLRCSHGKVKECLILSTFLNLWTVITRITRISIFETKAVV